MIAEDPDHELIRLAEVRRRAQSSRLRKPSLEVVSLGAAPDQNTDDKRRYRFGISNLDRALGPVLPGGMTLIAAVSGMGKTVIGEQLAVANAADGRTVMFATLEMTIPQIKLSILARHMGLALEPARDELREKTERYEASIAYFKELPLYLWRPEPRRPRTVEAILAAAKNAEADVLIVDYTRHIQGWEPGNKASAIVETFSNAAKETGIQIALLSQLKLDSHGKRPTPADVEDTRRLFQEADKVLFLHRPFFTKNERRDTVTEIICPKNRFGRVFMAHTHWTGPVRSFFAMDEEEESRVECCKKRPKAPKAAEVAQAIVDAHDQPQAELFGPSADESDPHDEGYWPSQS